MLSLSQSLVLGSQYNWEELQRFPSSSTHSLPQLSTLPTRVGLSPVMSLPLLHCHPVCKVYHPASLMMTKGQQQQKIKSPAVPFSEVFCLIFNGASEFGQTTNYTLTSAQKTPLAPRPWVCLCLVASSLAAPFVMPDFPTSHSVLRVSNCPKEKPISKHQVSSSRCLFFHDRLAQLQMSQQPFQASRPTPSVDFSLPRSLSKSLTRASSQPKDFPTYSHDGWFLS